MITSVKMKNFGVLEEINWENLSNINLIIGPNGTGKTFLMKAIYCSIKTIEEYRRGDDNRSEAEIISQKLRWTFQTDNLRDLIRKPAMEDLSCEIIDDEKEFRYGFNREAREKVTSITNETDPRSSNSIYLPAKEVLSLHSIILRSRDQYKEFGFDDTYFDLAKALQILPSKGKNYGAFSKSKRKLEEMIGGRIDYDESEKRWQFKEGRRKFNIGVTAEGIKKIAILDTLLSNRYLDNKSIIFIDEPEAALHPGMITDFLDVIYGLAKCGVQFFIASHSYFVLKKLYLIAKFQKMSIPVISLQKDGAAYEDLKIVLPDNSIIDESIKLYEEEVDGVTE